MCTPMLVGIKDIDLIADFNIVGYGYPQNILEELSHGRCGAAVQ